MAKVLDRTSRMTRREGLTVRCLGILLLTVALLGCEPLPTKAPAPAEPPIVEPEPPLPGYYVSRTEYRCVDDRSGQPQTSWSTTIPNCVPGLEEVETRVVDEWVQGTPPGGVKTTSGSGLVQNGAPHCLENEVAVITARYTDDFGRAGVSWDCYRLPPEPPVEPEPEPPVEPPAEPTPPGAAAARR